LQEAASTAAASPSTPPSSIATDESTGGITGRLGVASSVDEEHALARAPPKTTADTAKITTR
jgi:hypothetical protein